MDFKLKVNMITEEHFRLKVMYIEVALANSSLMTLETYMTWSSTSTPISTWAHFLKEGDESSSEESSHEDLFIEDEPEEAKQSWEEDSSR